MSFFDEADGPRTARRDPPRRARSSGGGGRRPTADPQTVRRRQLMLAGGLLVLLLVVVFGVSSCESSARRSALGDYNSNLVAVIQQSNGTGRQFFGVLTGGGSVHAVQTSLNEARDTADQQLAHVRGLSVPDEARQAQDYLLLVMQMRRDGIAGVAAQIQAALAPATSRDGVGAIAAEMARFYASDALYKDYAVPSDLGALKAGGVPVGGSDGAPVEGGQFLPDLRWLQPAFVASQLHVGSPTVAQGPVAPGVHGHRLESVSVGGTALSTAATNTVPASPPPAFVLSFLNTGQNTEHNVTCTVSVQGTGVGGQATVPQTTPGQPASCTVTLTASPPVGTETVTATIERVPGEKSVVHNTQTFTVDFK